MELWLAKISADVPRTRNAADGIKHRANRTCRAVCSIVITPTKMPLTVAGTSVRFQPGVRSKTIRVQDVWAESFRVKHISWPGGRIGLWAMRMPDGYGGTGTAHAGATVDRTYASGRPDTAHTPLEPAPRSRQPLESPAALPIPLTVTLRRSRRSRLRPREWRPHVA